MDATKRIESFEVAEEALQALEAGKFPSLKRFLSGASCDLRVIEDSSLFSHKQTLIAISDAELEGSTSRGVIRVSRDNSNKFVLLYEGSITESESELFAKTLQTMMAVSYAAIGLDMSCLGERSRAEEGKKEKA